MEGSKPIYKVVKEDNVYAAMRDGIKLACDVYRPDAPGKFPALLSMCPYTKERQAQDVKPLPFTPEFAAIEKGDTEYFVSRGYVHVVADIRGTGHSEGKYDICCTKEQEDGYDFVEWVAQQPWCDGNVGMVGISYLGFIQYFVAAQQPPHLKAIFPHDGWTDMYRHVSHHGGILMSGWLGIFAQGGSIVSWDAEPASEKLYSKEALKSMVEKLRNNKVISKGHTLFLSLIFPKWKPTLFDWLINELDGPYYWERSAYTRLDKIKIPVYLGSEVHGYPVIMHLPGAFQAWEGIKAPRKLAIRPGVPERPFHEFHDEIVRWYDHWLKGIDTGIMREPPIKIWVRGAERWRYGEDWPLKETKWKKLYLRADKSLQEAPPTGEEKPDSFNHKPVHPLMAARFPIDPIPEYLTYSTEPMKEDTEIVGPIVLNLYSALSGEDADFIVKIKDVSPNGDEFVLSRGWLKASHRKLDINKSRTWLPYHPHTRAVPVNPSEVNEYAIEVRPIANLFKKGHRIKLEIWGCDYPSDKMDLTLAWPVWSHLSYDKEVSYNVHHNQKYQSHLLLPVVG